MEAVFLLLAIGWITYLIGKLLKRWISGLHSAKLIKATLAARSIPDEAYFEMAGEELARGSIRKGLWVKALSEALGDEKKAHAIYLRLRVESMRREAADQIVASHSNKSESSDQKTVIHCPSCHSRLRVDSGKLLDITCPRCSHHFRQQVN